MIDPAESFSNALNQGLGIMKSYRDEARQSEKDAFERSMILKADQRDDERFNREKIKWGWEDEDRDYTVNTLRPLELRKAKADTTVSETNAEWLPKEKEQDFRKGEADIKLTTANTANTYDSIRSRRAGDAIEAGRFKMQQTEWQQGQAERRDRIAARELITWMKTGGKGGDLSRTAGTRFSPTRFMGMAGMSPLAGQVLEKIGRNDYSWMSDPKANQAVRGLAAQINPQSQQRLGFVPGTGVIDSFVSGKGGKVKMKFVGRDAKTGKLRTALIESDANQLFNSANIMTRTFGRIARDPNARNALTSMVQQTDPEFFAEVAMSVNPTIKPQMEALSKRLEKLSPTDKAYKATVDAMEQLAQRATGSTLFDAFSRIGGGQNVPAHYRAIERQRAKVPQYANAPTERVVADMNNFVGAALSSDQNYTKAMNRLYGVGGWKPRFSGRTMVRDENALWNGLAR